MALTINSPLVDAVGLKSAKALRDEFEMQTVMDLLAHYPRRYLRAGDASSEDRLVEGDHLTFFAEVMSVQWFANRSGRGGPRRGRCVVTLALEHGSIDAIFWNQPWIQKILYPGARALFTGIVGVFQRRWQLNSPTAEILVADKLRDEEQHRGLTFTSMTEFSERLMPIYPASAKVDSGAIRRCVEMTLDVLPRITEPLPASELKALGIVDLDTAMRLKHRPLNEKEWKRADKRLKLQEALTIQLALSLDRYDLAHASAVPRPLVEGGLRDALDQALPFSLTNGQQNAGEIIANELARPHPMHRLLQGDVGSGKTLVALRAMLQVAASGGQSALLAPTEVLAHQHARSMRALLEPFGEPGTLGAHDDAVKVVVLSAGMPAKQRKQALLDAASGAAAIVIGTHAILESNVTFADLGLVVIDEQHRFGVEQRDVLRRKRADGAIPHTLVMTATPIPRTIAMTAFGNLETITMHDRPAGRSEIATTAIPAGQKPAWVDRAWARIREEVNAGHQAYIVCPRIGLDEPEDDVELEEDESGREKRVQSAVLDVAAELASGPLSGLRIATLHGKMPAEEKDAIMQAMSAGEIDVLVSTTVIEVGVDVPNATIMTVLDADLFGLATLHQLRGRVGRGSAAGTCLLITPMHPASRPFERLSVLERTNDGFEIAERDLQLRREGDILGVAQSGRASQLRLLSLRDDVEVLDQARDICDRIIDADPSLEHHQVLRAALESLTNQGSIDYLQKG